MALLTVASLYSGIGGSDLGFQLAGFRVLWQAERASDRRAILTQRWPEAAHYGAVELLDLQRGVDRISTVLWVDLTDPDRWPVTFETLRVPDIVPTWTVLEASPSLALEPILRDLVRADWGFMPLYLQLHTTVPTLGAEWEDHRLRLLLVITRDGRHRRLAVTSPMFSMDVTTHAAGRCGRTREARTLAMSPDWVDVSLRQSAMSMRSRCAGVGDRGMYATADRGMARRHDHER